MTMRKILIAVICLIGWIIGSTVSVSRGVASVPVYLDAIIGPAVMRADRVIRERPAPDATSVQIDALNARQGAALQRLRGTLLGKQCVAMFVVTNVVNDTQNGGFDVDGDIKLDQEHFYNLSARQAIAEANKYYMSIKRYDKNGAVKRLQRKLAWIASNTAPPAQQIVIHTIDPSVTSWMPGQSRIVFGSVTGVHEAVIHYGGKYPDSFDTNNGGDYVACVVYMDWIAAQVPQAAGKVPVTRKQVRAKFTIVLKNGSIVHATSCKKNGVHYDVTEYGMQIEIPVANVVSVTKSAPAQGK